MAGNGKRMLLMGSEACAEGAIAAGVRFFAAYPITPGVEITERMSWRLPQVGGKFLQMEDELACIAAVMGASLGGAKAMTASSGPGISLMQESIGMAAWSEIPCVIINVQRSQITTQPTQGDVMQAQWGPHGDHPVIALAPSTVKECFDITIKAVHLAERLRVPAIVLSDRLLGDMREVVNLPDYASIPQVERPRPTCPPEQYHCYDAPTLDSVPAMADFGSGYRSTIIGTVHDWDGFPMYRDPEEACRTLEFQLRRQQQKLLARMDEIALTQELMVADAEVLVVAYGTVARSAQAAVREARARGWRAGLLKLITLWPFPAAKVAAAAQGARAIIVPEMNLGQITGEVAKATRGLPAPVYGLHRVDGQLHTPEEIVQRIQEVM